MKSSVDNPLPTETAELRISSHRKILPMKSLSGSEMPKVSQEPSKSEAEILAGSLA